MNRRETIGTDAGVGFVIDVDVERDVGPEDRALGAVLGEAVERGERIGRDGRAQPLDDVAVIVVMRRLH